MSVFPWQIPGFPAKKAPRLGRPIFALAAAAAIVIAAAVIAAPQSAAAIAEQDDQQDNPAEVTATEVIIAHKIIPPDNFHG